MRVKLIFLMILIILFTIFVVQNTEPVDMTVFFWRIEQLPKIILLTVILVIGIISGILISAFINRKKKEKVKGKDFTEIKKQ
ncbi:MAG: lipopolysaccharide assembly protein LapA domain-containing protein [Ignavibacteria bacterium]|nr:lipopolysaccharide assembly protein LapA domain-containing protein [Ignavibacteria bacterium]